MLVCRTRAFLVKGHRNLHSEQFPWYVPPPSALLRIQKQARGTMNTIHARILVLYHKFEKPYKSSRVYYSKAYKEQSFDSKDNGNQTRNKMRTPRPYSKVHYSLRITFDLVLLYALYSLSPLLRLISY